MAGRRQNENFEKLNFKLIKRGNKYQAQCSVCGLNIKNTAAARLQSHRYLPLTPANISDYNYVAIVDNGTMVLLENKESKEVIGIPNTNEIIKAFNVTEEANIVMDSEENSSVTQTKTWNDNATRMLINQYKLNEMLFRDNSIKNDILWKAITEKLLQSGHHFNTTQIINKWKHLKKQYMKEKDNMGPKSSGEAAFSFKYFEEMDIIFNKQPNVVPVATASSSKGCQINNDIIHKSFNDDNDVCAKKRKLNNGETKKIKNSNQLISWMEERNKEKEIMKDKRHKENLELQKEAMNNFKDVMAKLIDKL